MGRTKVLATFVAKAAALAAPRRRGADSPQAPHDQSASSAAANSPASHPAAQSGMPLNVVGFYAGGAATDPAGVGTADAIGLQGPAPEPGFVSAVVAFAQGGQDGQGMRAPADAIALQGGRALSED
jgi:hypothetical protein